MGDAVELVARGGSKAHACEQGLQARLFGAPAVARRSGSSIRWIPEERGFGLAPAVGRSAIAVRAVGTRTGVVVRPAVATRTAV
jgi:hypothetical protein